MTSCSLPIPLRRARSWASRLLPLVAVPLLACSTVRLIAFYDDVVDQSATALQKKMDLFLSTLERKAGQPDAAFAPNAQFYTDYAVELRSLQIRAKTSPKNDITVKQLDLMVSSLDALRTLHQAGPLSAQAVEQTRTLFNIAWQAILTLEVAKKRGEAKD